MEYKLSAVLQAHEDDVRDVTFAGQSAVISASRDATVRVWKRQAANQLEFDETIAFHGSAFVNSVAFIPPSSDYPAGLIASGGKDAIIDVREPGKPPDSNAERLLLGHEGNVCSLDVSPDLQAPYLVSGSWDATARIWNVANGETTTLLEGHEGSVWAVLAYDRKVVITGCADKVIRVFDVSGKLLRSIKGSTDVVRALCRIPEGTSAAQFASTGNDNIIRLWTIGGLEVAQLHGHDNFIYSLASLPDGSLVSSSEDRTVRIWKDQACLQTITHPAISVWTVAACAENGDIVSGSSDRIVRIFTRDKTRAAPPEIIRQFEDSVKSSAIPKQQMPDIDKTNLPGPEFLTQKSGTKEGQVQMIREPNGNISAHQWSASAQQWTNVGTVVDAVGSNGRRQEYMGQDYDYVFDVDIEEGKPPLKLPYNISQNAYDVATKFISDNELPTSYVDQIVNFLITNTQGATIGQGTDPSPAAPHPFGQESRYQPSQEESAAPKPKIIPQRDYLLITTATFSMMFKKIADLNQKLVSEGRKDLSLSPGELQILPDLTPELESALTSKPITNPTPPISNGINVAVRIITQWPPEARIPGLDLLRCLCAATPAVTTTLNPKGGDYLSILEPLFTYSNSANVSTQNYVNTIMLCLRSFANLFAHAPGRTLCARQFASIWGLTKPCLKASGPSFSSSFSNGQGDPIQVTWNRNVHIAAMTLAINYAILFILSGIAPENDSPVPKSTNEDYAAEVAADLVGFLQDAKIVDSETIYRALVALGTLMYEPKLKILGNAGVKENISQVLQRTETAAKEPRIKAVVGEIRAILG